MHLAKPEVTCSGSSSNANVEIDGNGDPHSFFSFSVVMRSVIVDLQSEVVLWYLLSVTALKACKSKRQLQGGFWLRQD